MAPRHRLFPRTFTPRVVLMLLVQQRLDRQATKQAKQQQDGSEEAADERRGAMLRARLPKG